MPIFDHDFLYQVRHDSTILTQKTTMEQNLTIPEIQKQLRNLKEKIVLVNRDYAKSNGGNNGADFKAIQVANNQRVDLEGQLAKAQNANPKARPFIGPVSPPKQTNPNQSPFDPNNIFPKPKQKVTIPPPQYVPNIQDMINNPNKYAADWNKKQAQDADWAKKNPSKPARTGKIHLRVHEGDSNDALAIGHSWVKVTWSNGKEETLELQPKGHYFGGGDQDDAWENKPGTLNRKFENELVFPFDENKWKDLNTIKTSVNNRNWTLCNNCTDYPIEIIKNVTGVDFGDFGPELPGTLSKRMYLHRVKNNIRLQTKKKL